MNIAFVLNKSRMPEKAGSTLCPMANTIVLRNPTVRACRDAPQMPGASPTEAAHIPNVAAINNQK